MHRIRSLLLLPLPLLLAAAFSTPARGTLAEGGSPDLPQGLPPFESTCHPGANSTGKAALLRAFGSPSASSGALALRAYPVPDDLGFFVHAARRSDVYFGDGRLCVNEDLVRTTPAVASGNLATYAFDNSDAAHSLAPWIGTTRHIQYVFRDPTAGRALFTSSSVLSVPVWN